MGAFKSTPIRNLETETWVPPLDLYFNKRLADFKDQTAAACSRWGREDPREHHPHSVHQDIPETQIEKKQEGPTTDSGATEAYSGGGGRDGDCQLGQGDC